MKDYLDGHSLMHPLSDGSWVIDEDPFYYVSNGVKITFIKDTVPDPETKAFLEKFRKNTSRSISNVRDFVAPLSLKSVSVRTVPFLKSRKSFLTILLPLCFGLTGLRQS